MDLQGGEGKTLAWAVSPWFDQAILVRSNQVLVVSSTSSTFLSIAISGQSFSEEHPVYCGITGGKIAVFSCIKSHWMGIFGVAERFSPQIELRGFIPHPNWMQSTLPASDWYIPNSPFDPIRGYVPRSHLMACSLNRREIPNIVAVQEKRGGSIGISQLDIPWSVQEHLEPFKEGFLARTQMVLDSVHPFGLGVLAICTAEGENGHLWNTIRVKRRLYPEHPNCRSAPLKWRNSQLFPHYNGVTWTRLGEIIRWQTLSNETLVHSQDNERMGRFPHPVDAVWEDNRGVLWGMGPMGISKKADWDTEGRVA